MHDHLEIIRPRAGVQVGDETRGSNTPGKVQRDITLTARSERGALPRGTVCATLQVATADDFVISGNDTAVLFDRVALPSMRIFLNPSSPLRVWFQDVSMGHLGITSNANALVGGTGQVQWLVLGSSQAGTSMFFHDMAARHVGVIATTTRPRFSIRIGPGTDAGYYQPARAPGELAKLYPVWIDGPVSALSVPAGHVDAMPLTPAIRNEARSLRDEVLARAGTPPPPSPSFPRTDTATRAPQAAQPLTEGQKVADGFAPYLPAGVTLTAVQVWKSGGALEGSAPDDAVVQVLMASLRRSPDVSYVERGYSQAKGAPLAFRVVFGLSCTAPGTASVCLPGTGGAYTEAQIRGELLPLIGAQVTLTKVELRDDKVLVEGRGNDAAINAALARIDKQAPWIRASTSAVGNGSFWARMNLACKAPPPAQGGICQAAASKR